jgi:alkanesulfonate monooxygenase SsuD/methylene tetrahydromethanopterin reductase-like flavin-dependent oxidoreductase (luciferase family)
MRQLATHFFGLGRNEFVGSPQTVAAHIDDFVQNRGSDGFIIGAHLNPTGLGEFVDRVIPLLQERGSFHTEYTGATLRENLGLPALPAAG